MGNKIKAFLVGTVIIGGLLAIPACVGFSVYAQIQTCRTYYPEVSRWICVWKDYDAPAKKARTHD